MRVTAAPLWFLQQSRLLPGLSSCGVVLLLLLLFPLRALADEGWDWGREMPFTPSYNDFGGAGLLQMPAGRMMPDGQFHVGVSSVPPYRRLLLNVQALPWLEAGFRLTQITNRIEQGSLLFGKTQSFYDRGIDLKFRLVQENENWPEISVGFRDIGGTNLFSSEYLVGSRRWYNLDFTLGVAWGGMGSRGGIKNPFTFVSDRFKSRPGSGTEQAGTFDPGRFFSGQEIALFGGVEYIMPYPGIRLVLEYDGNSYQNEPLGNAFPTNTPINAGVEYAVTGWLHLAAGLERGNRLMLRTSLTQNLMTTGLQKLDDPAPKTGPRPVAWPVRHVFDPALLQRPCPSGFLARTELTRIEGGTYSVNVYAPCRLTDAQLRQSFEKQLQGLDPPEWWNVSLVVGDEALPPQRMARLDAEGLYGQALASYRADLAETQKAPTALARRLHDAFKQANLEFEAVRADGTAATVWFRQGRYREWATPVGRAARTAAAVLPAHIERIRIIPVERGLPLAVVNFQRQKLEQAGRGRASPAELWHDADVSPPGEGLPPAGAVRATGQYPRFNWGIAPDYRQNFGGPDAYYVYQVFLNANAQAELRPGLLFGGNYALNVYNTFDQLQLESDSILPKVRSDVKNYLQQGDTGLNSLDLTYLFNIAPNWYGKAQGGLLELMFAGVGGEIMYAPMDKPWMLGVDLWRVRQRAFDLGFGLRDYEVTTGHANLHYKLPFHDLTATVRVGQYLAGDRGATFELSRRFESGIEVGTFATKTDVSAAEFGEGSFDKGFYVTFPLDLFFLTPARQTGSFLFRPTQRDGGARLGVNNSLYGLLRSSREQELRRDWRDVLE